RRALRRRLDRDLGDSRGRPGDRDLPRLPLAQVAGERDRRRQPAALAPGGDLGRRPGGPAGSPGGPGHADPPLRHPRAPGTGARPAAVAGEDLLHPRHRRTTRPMSRTRERWTSFWFEPVATSTLALVRLAFGLLVFAWTLSLTPDLSA